MPHTNDGVRLYIDNILVLDSWWDGYKEPTNNFRRIGAGPIRSGEILRTHGFGLHPCLVDPNQLTDLLRVSLEIPVWWCSPGFPRPPKTACTTYGQMAQMRARLHLCPSRTVWNRLISNGVSAT
jgi:hypothetical protein